jgi:DNA replication protein DnaC
LWVVDEGGDVPVDRDGSPLLFRVIADRDDPRRLILTTTLACSTGGRLFPDDPRAAALMDRRAHPGPLLLFDGDRYRLTPALMTERSRRRFRSRGKFPTGTVGNFA